MVPKALSKLATLNIQGAVNFCQKVKQWFKCLEVNSFSLHWLCYWWSSLHLFSCIRFIKSFSVHMNLLSACVCLSLLCSYHIYHAGLWTVWCWVHFWSWWCSFGVLYQKGLRGVIAQSHWHYIYLLMFLKTTNHLYSQGSLIFPYAGDCKTVKILGFPRSFLLFVLFMNSEELLWELNVGLSRGW